MSQQRRRVLANRYELDSVLGQGGMARVFRGTDRVLNRTVAVKVLSPQFADDEQFVARFRREAQAAAALNHPNIVSVFDTGSQGDVHFIVMELVEGRTLRDVIRGEGPLLPERASEIAEAVCRALTAAHQAGMVHRDVKPGNIMITPEGEVKVMDFGIARTSTGDTLTQTAAVLGTASYLSPEQAQGESVDARSDVYSVGCVLYEMLTGSAPFSGDSPIAIAYKHIRDNPTPPSQLNADVPAGLETVVMKCMAKSPGNRYQSAEELRHDLERARQGLPIAAVPIVEDATQAFTRAQAPVDQTSVMTGVPPDERPDRRRIWPVVLVVLLVLAVIGGGAYFLINSLAPTAETIPVPNVIGDEEEEATRRLERAGLQVSVETEFNEEEKRGVVFEQDPAGGEEAEEGDTVTLTVSRGARPLGVPGVVGMTLDEATQEIEAAGFTVGEVTEEEAEQEEGIVIGQDPPEGERSQPETPVNLVVSEGPGTVTVPSVFCQPIGEAEATIEDAGLGFDVTGAQFSEQCPEGSVADQSPDGGAEVEAGTTVRVVESRGEEPEEEEEDEDPPTTPTIPPTPTTP